MTKGGFRLCRLPPDFSSATDIRHSKVAERFYGVIRCGCGKATEVPLCRATTKGRVFSRVILGRSGESTDVLDVMCQAGLPSNPCRVLKFDWDAVNP